MTIKEIQENWKSLGVDLNPLDPTLTKSLGLGDNTVDFLITCGLPSQGAPFLSFVNNSKRESETLCRLSDLYNDKKLRSYINLGFDGSGNPIAINTTKDDIIEVLDHEQGFLPMDFMNTSVFSLSACLFEYNKFVRAIISANGSSAFLTGIFSDEQFQALQKALVQIDSRSAANGFWAMELDMLKQNREMNSKGK